MQPVHAILNRPISTSRLSWFLRGLLCGVLLMGAANALSYLVRSGGWSGLLGGESGPVEAIGFPFEMWRHGSSSRVFDVDGIAMASNVAISLALGSLLGLVAVAQTRYLTALVRRMEQRTGSATSRGFQFSLRAILLITLLAAIVASMVRAVHARPEDLAAVYLFGPLLLVILAMLPRHIPWQQRVAIITPATVLLIAVALGIGASLGIDLDRVLLGIFVTWVPQTALAALALTLAMVVADWFRQS